MLIKSLTSKNCLTKTKTSVGEPEQTPIKKYSEPEPKIRGVGPF